MRSRGSERPEDGPEEQREPRPKGRRWGRGRPDSEPEEPVAGEEFGWIDDLRSAKQQRGELGPGGAPGQAPPPDQPDPQARQAPTAPAAPARGG
ncbi:hypothetical protein ACFPZ4_30800, partial [Micromonospora harpali]